MVAMAGKGCVAIASDLRLGNEALGIASNFQRVKLQLLLKDIPNFYTGIPSN